MKKTIMFVTLILSLLVSGHIYAANVAEQSGFTVDTTPSDLQTSTNSYYDLKMNPNQTTTLHVAVKNITNAPSSYSIQVNPALTSDNIIIDYSAAGDQKGVGAKPNVWIQQVAKPSATKLTVPANGTGKFDVAIKMTSQQFDGIIAGAIRVERITANKSEGITDKFAYVKGLVLRQNLTAIKPDLQVQTINAGEYKYQPGVIVKMINPTNINISGLEINSKITNDKDGSVVQVKNTTEASRAVAPNSSFNYVFRFTNLLPAGKYHFVGTAKDSNGNTWAWNQAFTITGTDKLDDATMQIKQRFEWWWVAIALLVLIILGLVWWIIFGKRKKDKDDEENETTTD